MRCFSRFAASSFSLFVLAGSIVFPPHEVAGAGTKVSELTPRIGFNDHPFAADTILEPPTDPDERVAETNPTIDCSTNPAYGSRARYGHKGVYGNHVHSVGFQNCNSCHTNGVGNGKPQVSAASFTLANQFNAPVSYEIQVGENGAWKEYTIEPGKSQRFSWTYERGAPRASPTYFVKYGGAKFRLVPYATPNINIGSLYYFASNPNGNGARIVTCRNQPYRQSQSTQAVRRW